MNFDLFSEFAIIILFAATLGLIATKLKQPPILGYILSGLILGPLTPEFDASSESLELLAKVGVALLLFTLGLELKLVELKKLGKVAFATGIGQIIFTSFFGYFISLALGFSPLASIYIAIALTFSSTIIIVKLLSTKNQLDTLFGKISVGFLLVQDFVAIIILIALSTTKNFDGLNISELFSSLAFTSLKGLLACLFIFITVKFILFPILNTLKMEREVLFLLTIAWALTCAAILGSEEVGFTIEVGGLVAGIALANRFEQLQIESWTRPLRDFFLALFFFLLGSHIQLDSISNAILPTFVFSIFVLIGNPLIVMIIMGFMGYKKKTSFMTSLAVAQISEFSLLVLNFAYIELGHVDNITLTVVTLVGGITMTASSYLIYYNEKVFNLLSPFLGIFEFRKNSEDELKFPEKKHKKIIVFGAKRTGRNLLKLSEISKDEVLVIDHNPDAIRLLRDEGYDAIYADMSDIDLYPNYALDKAEVIVSTVPNLHDNLTILKYLSSLDNKPVTVITANDGKGAWRLYEAGADLVVYPQLISGELISDILSKKRLSKSIVIHRTKYIHMLKDLA
jgi:Kef-type K+ transport system membrane component KefB